MTAFRFPWDEAPVRPSRPREARPSVPKRPRGRPKEASTDQTGAAAPKAPERQGTATGDAAVHHTEWLPFRLTVHGPAEAVAAFAAAAAGPGVTPWQVDFAAMEEDVFHRLASRYPRTGRLSLEGCRVFAAQLRERAEDRHRQVLVAAEGSQARPLDLHALLPVPPAVLALGPDHPDARHWLRTHWGTEELRRVERLSGSAGRRPKGQAEVRFGFFAADTGPTAAVRRMAKAWPGLQLDLRPAVGTSG
ncbi:Hypothetical protein HVIM_03846 (plasmid) [Roseomonas mucosa]|uniref:hypothetical protein n=1 Tax=Roseomonas mucosa TaxID=207340 RepID=UPI000DB82AE5|nr:hypothetical protein [Roseomonas mucosa]PZP42449.1 MAG: hypothetical protein DI601_18300 [Azospirillum brasilense]QDD92754.1 Hypothetical protein HVIM_03846 [Roseomonas mucosa]